MLAMIKDTIVSASLSKSTSVIVRANAIFRKAKLSYDGRGKHKEDITIALEFISNLANNSEVYAFTEFLRQQK